MNPILFFVHPISRCSAGLCAAFLLCLGGCRDSAPPTAPLSSRDAKSANGKSAKTANSTESRAIEAWTGALRKWAQGASGGALPNGASGAKSTPEKQPVYLNVAALARHHPAWRLADALENGIAVNADAQALTLSSAPFPRLAIPVARNGGSQNGFAAPSVAMERAPQRKTQVAARALPLLQERSAEVQRASLESFLRAASGRQTAEREAAGLSLQLALDEEIAAARRADLPLLDPDLPSRAIQLEMTNLRLRLLENARLSAAEKSASRLRLQSLEAQWRAMLHAQEDEHAAQLARLREDLPRRLRAEGGERLALQIETREAQDAAARLRARNNWSERIAADFAPEEARLAIALPADGASFRTPQSSSRIAKSRIATGARRQSSLLNFNQTFAGAHTSGRDVSFPGAQAGKAGRAAQVARLRREALLETQRWVRLLARRNGWKLEPASGVRDATSGTGTRRDMTGVALQMLRWN